MRVHKLKIVVIALRLLMLFTVLSLFFAWVHACAVLRQESITTQRYDAR
jgi:hypothetical protein